MTARADLHQRGLAAVARESWEEAIGFFARVVELEPAARAAHSNLGLALARAGRLEESAASYRAALALQPGHSSTLAKLGRVLLRLDRRDEALASLEAALAAAPHDADTLNALGAALASDPGETARACGLLGRAVEIDPAFGEAWANLALLEAGSGHWSQATGAYLRAHALEPRRAALSYQLGVALARMGRRGEALQAYREALALDPRMPEAWNNLGHELAAAGDGEQALEAVQSALAVKPDYIDARYNLGVTLQSLGRIEEARRAYQLVLAAAGAHADALNNLGGLCLSEAAPVLAAPLYERALAANPRHPEARWNLGLAQLAAGDWEPGWANYEMRPRKREFNAPAWRPGEPLAGRTVFVWCEQGLGDGVQFLRYTACLRALGAGRIEVECPRPLASLFSLAEGLDRLIAPGQAEPPADYQISLMSLPGALATRPGLVPPPGPPYRLNALRQARWRARLAELGGRRRIGIVWGGNPDNRAGLARSMPLEALARLGEIPGIRLVSLQHGPQCAELARFPQIAAWEQEDLADTAALVSELDLVISVDTLMAHLAGTLARRTCVLLPYAADWRWMTGRSDSPWYPGMRLFRQRQPRDWAGVTAEVAAALASAWLD